MHKQLKSLAFLALQCNASKYENEMTEDCELDLRSKHFRPQIKKGTILKSKILGGDK